MAQCINRRTGLPKRAMSEPQALALVDRLKRHSKRYLAYQCQVCGQWHVGKRKLN